MAHGWLLWAPFSVLLLLLYWSVTALHYLVRSPLLAAPRRTRVDMGTIQPVHVGHVLIQMLALATLLVTVLTLSAQ